ncbi:SGNH/GDSL hydrolase family protein [Peribacillus alkalitolerans]|uniref:SGNH/GDSL hydrolase family protein n=1 Tax=Peribacillus alkalitolerans TaxID=1550385 RepID=UPI0013D4A637|nr:SGNH/GDSL hydrolase family protein [Peribacillus alkalitolerans]
MRIILIFIGSIFLLSGCSLIQPPSKITTFHVKKETKLTVKNDIPSDFIPFDVHIVSLGDSLTKGVGNSKKTGGYQSYLIDLLKKEKQLRDVSVSNYGVRGNRSDQLLKRLNDEKIQDDVKNADSIIITIGGNDVMKVVREHYLNLKLKYFDEQKEVYEKQLIEILNKIRYLNPQADIYIVGLYNPFSKWMVTLKELDFIMKDWNASTQLIASNYNDVYYVEIQDIFNNSNENLLFEEDYFHPNDRGYELMAERIYFKFRKETVKNYAKEYNSLQ